MWKVAQTRGWWGQGMFKIVLPRQRSSGNVHGGTAFLIMLSLQLMEQMSGLSYFYQAVFLSVGSYCCNFLSWHQIPCTRNQYFNSAFLPFAAFVAVHRLLSHPVALKRSLYLKVNKLNISTSTSPKDFPEIMLKGGDNFPEEWDLFVHLLPVTWSSPHHCFCFTMKITPFSFNLEIDAVSCKSFTCGHA